MKRTLMKRTLRIVSLLALLAAFPLRADTNVSGNIATNTTWTVAGSPYILSGDVTVGASSGPTLTIEAGVVVKGNGSSQLLVNYYNKGALVVNGTDTAPVVFTSNGSTTAGAWYGLRFGSVAGAPASSLTYTTVEYAGSNTHSLGGITVLDHAPAFDHVTSRVHQYAGIKIENGSPSLTASAITENAGFGVYLTGGAVTLETVALTDNTGIALSAPANSVLANLSGVTASGNGTNALEIRAGTINANRTWKASAVPYLVNGSVMVESGSAPILTIEAGNTVRFAASSQIAVNHNNRGGLQVNGTSSAPVLFTSHAATPAAGAWWGLYFGGMSSPPASSVSYATIEWGGYSNASRGGITIYTGAPAFDHVTVRNSAFAGVAVHGGSPSFTDSTITANNGPGINGINAANYTLNGVAFTDNSGLAVTAYPTSTFTGMTGLSASGNGTGRDGIEIRQGTIVANTTWPASAIPYIITGTLDVNASAAPVLTIAAGNTIRFNASAQISVNHFNKGAIHAVGTPSAPILFTSNTASAQGSWLGLWVGGISSPPQSTIAYATIENGGSTQYSRGAVTINAGTPVFDNVTFRNHQFSGVVINNNAGAQITNSTITDNGGPGINAVGSGTPTLTVTDTAITNNSGYAVTLPVTATLTSPSGITATGNGTGRNAIEYRAGTMNANRTWPLSPIPYVVTGTIDINASSAPVLTIAAGNTIKFNSSSQLSCNHYNKGAIQAIGTATEPLLFTSNAASPAPGSWFGLWFGGTADPPQSNIAYATIEYGGSTTYTRGGIAVNAASPAFDHVTFRNNQYAGVTFVGGSPVITNSTITANGGPGISSTGGSALTLTNVAITNNSGYAVTLPVAVKLLDASGLSASGNGTGKDGIEYREGTINSNTTWPVSAIPYVVSGTIDVNASAAPVLTIGAGNTIKFNAVSQISINHYNKGSLQAIGTPAAPITFTSNGTATPGYWLGLWFGASSNPPQSNVSYAIIEYAGSNAYTRGAIAVNTGEPAFDHLEIRNNLHSALSANNSSRPRLTNSYLHDNPAGVTTLSSTAAPSAPLNYWNNAAGPCLAGSCATGQQSVSSQVGYEPWLLSAPSQPQFLATTLHKNRSFSPAIGASSILDYTTALSGDVTITIRNASSTVVRTLNASGTPGSLSWDGKNDSGVLQPDGTYSYEIAATATSQPPASIAKGYAVVDSTKGLTLSSPAVSLAFFSPNADTIQDATTITATTNYDDAAWTVSVLDGSSNVVRTHNGTGPSIAFTWDGKDGSSVVQPDGLYTLRVDAVEGTATQQKNGTTTLDNTAPVASIVSPAANDVLSNVYTSGNTVVTPTGNATDTNLQNWSMQVGSGATPSGWSTIGSGNTSVTSANLGTWETANTTNGTFSFRLLVSDKAGNSFNVTTSPVTLGNFKASQNAYQFNPSTGGTLTYTSTIPFPLTETVVVKNEAGTVVRNLVSSVARNAGTYNDVFNGRNDANVVLPDGPYFYYATVTDGTHTFTWDLSNVMRNDFSNYNDGLGVQAYDPFNNKPFTFNYNFAQPGRVSIATSTNPGSVVGDCANPPTATFYCPAVDLWQESGPQTFTWSGIDSTGAYRTIRSVAIVTVTNKFPRNAAVLFGTKPKVQNVKVTPPIFGPAVGTQTIEFDLTTYASQPADVSIALVNLSTNSTLRTLTVTGQAAGHATVSWDGRADNGMLVAPGDYSVVVTVTDQLGNVVRGGILTTIQY
jgi:flagellar hook assembly protein FlgD